MKLKTLLPAPYTLLLAPYALLLILFSCGTQKPITTTHHERIETQLQPIPISADTIEITLSRDAACCVRSPKTNKTKKIHSSFLTSHSSLKSTRGVSMQTTHTDTTQTLQITLRPDTIYIPYTTHIRSDTIVAPDPTTKTKMQKTQTANLLLILIIIAIIIIFFDKRTKRQIK